MELQRIGREYHRTTLFEFPIQPTQGDRVHVLAAEWIPCTVECPSDGDRDPVYPLY